jgi:hypothetical protein
MSSTPPKVGSIRLQDAAAPALPAGLYRITSGLEVERRAVGGQVSPLDQPASLATHLQVVGPRFSLDAADIAERHPSADARGSYGDRLPHVALGRRTLPWERTAPGGGPWLALLVLKADEAELATGPLSTLLPAPVVAALQPVDGDPAVTVVKVKDGATLAAVLPSQTELALLAHVRQVNLADSALAGSDDDGIFAIVVANRFPAGTAGDGTAYRACLISLEGRGDAWTAAAGQAAPPLIVLHSWKFTSLAQGGTFESLATAVHVGPFGAPAAGASAVIAPDGTVGVEVMGRDGTSASGRYRGPLLGLASGQPLAAPGGSDFSGAAAFELGRLLGISDGRFLRELTSWHRSADAAARTELARAELSRVLAPRVGVPRARRRAGPAAPAGAAAISATNVTTAAVRAALGARLTRAHGRPADLWQVHPAAFMRAAPEAKQKKAAVKKTTTPKKIQMTKAKTPTKTRRSDGKQGRRASQKKRS